MSTSYAASVQSTTGTIASYARKLGQNTKPDMEVILDNHQPGKIYTTFDALSGRVEITAPHNARFDEIQITLEGMIKTFVDSMSPTSTRTRTTASHTFLKLTMPIRDADYPQPRIAESGQTYKFPFNFVIPDQLLPRSCSHECDGDHVHQAHLQLPPSMGDRDLSRTDDFSPEMSRVSYAIKVKVVRKREEDGKTLVLVEGRKKLHVVPAVAEAPPMSLGKEDTEYVLSKTKSLKKGVFSGKLGRITVSAPQTGSLTLPSPSSSGGAATTMATVTLRFDPHDNNCQPPKLGGLSTKIKATTFFSVRPAKTLVARSSMVSQFETTRGAYSTSIPLSFRCVESVAWKAHQPSTVSRRNSATSTSSSDFSDDIHAPEPALKEGSVYYTATIIVPITLSTAKTWIPTFHSCISSRVYQLDLSLTVHTPSSVTHSTNISLHLPVQIAADGNQNARAAMTAEEAASELADVDEYLRPRIIEIPREELVGNSVLMSNAPELPPSYELSLPVRPVVDPGRS